MKGETYCSRSMKAAPTYVGAVFIWNKRTFSKFVEQYNYDIIFWGGIYSEKDFCNGNAALLYVCCMLCKAGAAHR